MGLEDLQSIKRTYSENITAVTTLTAKIITDEIEETLSKSSPFTKLLLKIGGKRAEEAAAPYISAIIMLAFEMKPITDDGLKRIINAAGIVPNARLLHFAASIKIAELLPYVPTAYLLKVNGLGVTEERIINVLNSIGVPANKESASKVLKSYMEKESQSAMATPGRSNALQEKIEHSITDVAKMISRLTNMELERTFERKDTMAYIKDLMPYLTATAELAFLGKDLGQINMDAFMANIRSIVGALGIKPEEKMIKFVSNLNYGNALMYVPPLFFFLSIKIQPTLEKIGDIAAAINIPRDDAQAGYVLTIYNDIKTTF